MLQSEFINILEERIEKIRKTLHAKAKEYAVDEDRLHNFKHDMDMSLAETPDQVCWGYLRKHLQCVYDMVHSDKRPTVEQIDEKIGDAINYLILLEAIFKEQLNS